MAPSLNSSQNRRLPPEMWLSIFNWATFYPTRNAYSTTYQPFCDFQFSEADRTFRTKRVLALVCREWYALSKEFLYQDIRIGRSQGSLMTALDRRGDGAGYAKLVRRVVLPYQSTTTATYNPNPLPSVEILKLCNQLEVLVRPRLFSTASPDLPIELPRFEFEADCTPLPTLKRLDWNYNFDAERTGGINSLNVVLRNAPNLQYLFLGNFTDRTYITTAQPIQLPHLRTLSLSAISAQILYQLGYRWSLPSLTHIIIGALYIHNIESLWENYGEQLGSVEFGRHLGFLMGDHVGPCLASCPNLEELYYYIFFTLPPTFTDVHYSITSVGLHAATNMMVEDESIWKLLENHFSALLGGALPELRHVHLFGDWDHILHDKRFAPSSARLRSGGYEVHVYP
ncbi:hypothetical protein Moror_4787 [Moniliophthora roreri MCA 2997]|uniref:F-box domain-containing protein n=1 Tax=Moniliophthora roreri (strain MCA 2997) TaxID=1381753 RepID=V2XH56_MONRO|nr:hypothetical protein Moror_4787 [Moniliophthora roreri MCA 2997]